MKKVIVIGLDGLEPRLTERYQSTRRPAKSAAPAGDGWLREGANNDTRANTGSLVNLRDRYKSRRARNL